MIFRLYPNYCVLLPFCCRVIDMLYIWKKTNFFFRIRLYDLYNKLYCYFDLQQNLPVHIDTDQWIIHQNRSKKSVTFHICRDKWLNLCASHNNTLNVFVISRASECDIIFCIYVKICHNRYSHISIIIIIKKQFYPTSHL